MHGLPLGTCLPVKRQPLLQPSPPPIHIILPTVTVQVPIINMMSSVSNVVLIPLKKHTPTPTNCLRNVDACMYYVHICYRIHDDHHSLESPFGVSDRSEEGRRTSQVSGKRQDQIPIASPATTSDEHHSPTLPLSHGPLPDHQEESFVPSPAESSASSSQIRPSSFLHHPLSGLAGLVAAHPTATLGSGQVILQDPISGHDLSDLQLSASSSSPSSVSVYPRADESSSRASVIQAGRSTPRPSRIQTSPLVNRPSSSGCFPTGEVRLSFHFFPLPFLSMQPPAPSLSFFIFVSFSAF